MKAILRSIKKRISGAHGKGGVPLPTNATISRTTEAFLKICAIHGWFTLDDCAHFSMALGFQSAMGLRGDILEIGSYYGRSSAFLAGMLNDGEKLFISDLFEAGDTSAYGKCPTPEKVVSNILSVNPGLKPDAIRVFKGDSSKLRFDSGQAFRFIHVDGGHTFKDCLSDLRLSDAHLVEMGIMVVDDYMHPDWPEVTDAVTEFLKANPKLSVVADLNRAGAIGRKLYLIKRR